MKINFDSNNQNPNVDKVTTSKENTSFYKMNKAGAIALDISGIVMDNTAYGDHGRTAEDVMQEAGSQFDVGLQRDYMTVMSNSMSSGDFNKMMEEGFDPSKLDVDKVVTIVDHIKASLAQSGEIVAGYNDNLSTEKLTQITGNAASAQKLEDMMSKSDVPVTAHNANEVKNAVEKAGSIQEFSDGSIKYMVENDLEPTIENIYLASFSAAGDGSKQPKGYYAQEMPGYYARKADDIDWQQLEPQIEKAVSKMELDGLSQQEKMENAKWLVEKGIPVTEKAMGKLSEIRSISFPITFEGIAQAAITAIGEGKTAVEGNLVTGHTSIYEQAVQIKEQTDDISQQALWQVVKEDKKLNLRNLFEAENNVTQQVQIESTNPAFISAQRILEEVRLQMTLDANVRLLKSGVSIDTTQLSQLVDELKQQETSIKSQLFGDGNTEAVEQKASLYQSTRSILNEIPYLPAAVLGRMTLTEEMNTVSSIYENGSQLKAKLESAGTAYETLMTSPRRDMGDSIQKAFQNVDTILTEMGFDLTDENRKAVRILGYNSMEINKDAVNKVKNADKQIENIVKSMTPGKTLQLIREGKNPLTMDLSELENSLHNMEMQPVDETEKFSKYLYRLEQNKEISQPERDAYIGVYRLFHQIEKSDGAAVGSLVSQGAELTLGNLLSAVRSRKKDVDVTVDDNFGLLNETIQKGTSISRQIEDGILEARLAHSVYRDISPEALQNVPLTQDTTLNEIAQAVSENNETNNQDYEKDILQDIRNAVKVENSIIETLQMYEQPVSTNQLMAADTLFNDRGGLFYTGKKFARQLDEVSDTNFESQITEASDEVIEQFTDKESAQAAYEDMTNRIRDVFSTATEQIVDTTIDLKAISLCHKQLSLMTSLSKQESYEIPVTIGNSITAIHLSVQHEEETKGTVRASFDTPDYGRVSAKFTVENNKISAIFTSDDKAGLEKLKQVGSVMEQQLVTTGQEMQETHYILGNQQDKITLSEKNADNNSETVSNRELYRLAKSFLTAFHSVKTEGESI